jgi:hypothetical protein
MGAWRYYAPGYLCADDCEVDDGVISQILLATDFDSVEAFNNELGAHDRGELPEALQAKLKAIFSKPTYSSEDVPAHLSISDGVVSSLQESIELKCPFKLAQEHKPLEIGIYAMSIENEDGVYTVNLRAGVSSAKLFEAASEDLEPVCSVLIDKLASAKSDEIDNSDKAELRAYLKSNGADLELVDDDDFLEELGMQVRYMVETIGIATIPFSDDSGDEVEFWIEAEEEIGFS